jgi:hypothetical protein
MAGNGFYPAYVKGGGATEATARYIATNVAIEKGEIVQYGVTGITALTEGTDFDDPAFGVAAEFRSN